MRSLGEVSTAGSGASGQKPKEFPVEAMAVEVGENVKMNYKEEAEWKDRKVEDTSHSSSGQTLRKGLAELLVWMSEHLCSGL